MQNDYQLYRPRQQSYFLDLFSGIGGFHLGTQWAGLHFDGYYYSEVDPYAIKVYAKRFPNAIGLGDITKIDGRSLPQGDWIIAGGFPCQDISVAGKGAGLAGERSGLWYEYARIIGELRPRYAIMENVGALTFRGLDAVLGSLAEIGYDAEWQDIRASDVGAPHRRERIWIVAYPTISECATGAEKPGKLREVFENWREHDNADGSGANVPNPDEIMRNRSGGTWNGRIKPTNGREALANSDEQSVGRATKSRRERGQWTTEPDVGRSLDGLPSWLDRCIGRGVSNAENTRRVEALRALWSDHVSKTLRRAIGGFERIQQAEILFSFLRQYENGIDQARLLVEGKEVDDDFLRSLRRDAMATGSPYRPEQGKQSAGEYPDTVQMVSRILALDSAPNWAGDSWEDAIPRVAHKIPARVDRLKCLGNSIVPQIAQMIFQQPAFDEWRNNAE